MKEKAFTRTRDRLAAERRSMPWMPVEKAYQILTSEKRIGVWLRCPHDYNNS